MATSTMINEKTIEEFEDKGLPALTRDAILNADESDLVGEVDVPEWGGVAYIRVMSGCERDALEAEMTGEKKNLTNFRGRFAVKVLSDEKGNRIFKDSEADIVGKRCCTALDRILKAGLDLNGFSEQEIDDLEKN